MAYRVLVDENVDPQTAELLREQGHEAIHVEETLGKGTADSPIADFAQEHGYLVLTNDVDFLRPDRGGNCRCSTCRRTRCEHTRLPGPSMHSRASFPIPPTSRR